jgi:cysteine-rich repeat protein
LWELCRDSVVQADEECDDGNRVNGDGCSSTCELEACGDGVVQPSEGCDDGNTTAGDGCDASCEVEEEQESCAQTGGLPAAIGFLLLGLFAFRRRRFIAGTSLLIVLLLGGCETRVTATPDHLSPRSHTSFPIRTGDLHAWVRCAECHSNATAGTFDRFDCVQCHGGVEPSHERIVGFELESSFCYQCHFDGTTFPKDAFVHSAFPIERGGHSDIDCDSCHVPEAPRSIFQCTGCHGGESNTNRLHGEVPGYVFDSASCFACHPNGTG